MFKSAVFTWIGIIGGIFTVFSNLEGIIDFADWGHWLASAWGDAVDLTMARLFLAIDLKIEKTAGMMAAMAIFVSAIAVGAWLQNAITKEETFSASIWNVLHWRLLLALVLYLSFPALIMFFSRNDSAPSYIYSHWFWFSTVGYIFYVLSIVIGLPHWPIKYSAYVAACMLFLSYCFESAALHRVDQPNVSTEMSIAIAAISAVFCGLTVAVIAPPKAFVWRLTVIMCGVATLALLSQISLLGLAMPSPR